jgi:tetratricopeptide (TPR) repeat protein
MTLEGKLSVVVFLLAACQPPAQSTEKSGEQPVTSAREPEATSLLGAALYAIDLAPEDRAKLDANYQEAKGNYDRDPKDVENIIWLGRRLGYLWKYREAIDVYSRGLELHPDNPKLYRHRGHRHITVREFDKAAADLERAVELIRGTPDEIEPDGAPNPEGKPRSSLHFNVWYHLGLAYYLEGDFENALRCYVECMKASTNNDDSLVATSDWLYMTYRRLGQAEEAAMVLEPIREEMDIIENHSYHKRLLMYKGVATPESLLSLENPTDLDVATQGYGVGNWYLYNGQRDRAKEIFQKIVAGKHWAAFGFIAAEAELNRMSKESGS